MNYYRESMYGGNRYNKYLKKLWSKKASPAI